MPAWEMPSPPAAARRCLRWTSAFASGPALRLSYLPDGLLHPFALSAHTGLDLLGSPARAPFAISAEFNLLSNPPAFSLFFKPCIDDFSLANGDGHRARRTWPPRGRAAAGLARCYPGCASRPGACCRCGARRACGSSGGCVCRRTEGRPRGRRVSLVTDFGEFSPVFTLMADRKRGWGVASTARGPCRLLEWLRQVRPRRTYQIPPPPPSPSPSPSDPSSSTSSEVTGTRPSYPRPLIWGTRSIKQPTPWICAVCGFKNELSPHLLYHLPPFKCKSCDADPPEGSVDFGFCYGDLALNGFCPIGNVKDQIGPTCLANTLASAVEITHRLTRIIQGEPLSEEGPVVDVDDLIAKYKIWCRKRGLKYDNFDIRSLIIMLRVLAADGIKERGSDVLYKIHDWDYIDEDDFATLSSALADGYPLVAGFQTGKRVYFLQPGEIYMPPKPGSVSMDGKRKPIGHIALLVGAQQERGEKFFYFVSSWSEEFCSRMVEGTGILGGIGAIRADGIDFSPVHVLRFNERYKQEVYHPEYPSL